MQRRKFLQTTSYLAVGTLLPTKAAGCSKKKSLENIGLQLYSVRDAMQRDDAATLRKVAAIGYDYVEGAGYFDGMMYQRTPGNFKDLLDLNGLQMHSSHVGWEAMRDAPQKAIAACKAVGASYLVIPWWPEEKRDVAGYQELVELLNSSGKLCQDYGLQLAYHNHDFEFNRLVAGSRPINILLNEVDPDLVKFELDFYWVTRAGIDYKDFLKQHSGRFPLWHVKDMDDTADKFFAAVGEGVIDWPAVFRREEQAGMEYFFVEQDRTVPGKNPFDEVAISYKYLDAMEY